MERRSAIRPELSVIIPTLNEGKNIGPLIERLWQTIHGLQISAEIIVVDGGSTDETWAVAENSGAICLLQRRLGYGGALREGFLRAKGDYVMTLDSDLSHPPELLTTLWPLRGESDVIIGSRFTKGGRSDAPLTRHLLSRILNSVFAITLSIPIRDTSSGYRLYRRSVLCPDRYRPENFNILQEVLVRAYSDGYQVREVPLHYQERAAGDSHVSFVKFAISYLPTLYRLWKLRNSVTAADYEYRAYFSRHPLQRHWIRKRTRLLREFCGETKQLLDVGCGSSYFTVSTPAAVALDVAPGKLRFLGPTHETCVQANAESLPFAAESFDQIVMSQVLNYVENLDLAIREANRVLKTNGTLVIAVPDSRRIGWRLFGTLYRFLPNTQAALEHHQFSRSALVDQLAERGFRALRYRYICGAELVLKCQKVETLRTAT